MNINIPQEALLRQKDKIKSHPKFKEAIKEHYLNHNILYKKQPLFYKTMLQESRFNIALAICCFVFGNKTSCISDIKELCLRYEIASPNSVIAIITLLKTTNRIRTWRSGDDRRKILMEPTQKGIDELNDYIKCAFLPLKTMFPKHNINVNLLDNETQRRKFFSRVANFLSYGITFKKTLPDVGVFIEKDGGRMIMLYLYLHAINKMNSHCAVIEYSASILAREFSVSRTHTNLIIKSAQELKYLYRREDGMIEIYPSFIQLVEDYISLYFSYTLTYLEIQPAE